MSDTPSAPLADGTDQPVVGLLRRLRCHLRLCSGHLEHMRDADGVWWLGMRCAAGRFHDPIKSKYQDEHGETT